MATFVAKWTWNEVGATNVRKGEAGYWNFLGWVQTSDSPNTVSIAEQAAWQGTSPIFPQFHSGKPIVTCL